MGKYMRKCRGAMGEEVAAMEVTQVVGVRTRSRSASAAAAGVTKVQVSRRRKALPPSSPAGNSAAVAACLDSKSCYLQLRSRMLFMASPPAPAPAARALGQGVPGAASQQGAVLAAVLSRCSSTASSVDLAAQDRSLACRSVDAAAETGGEHVPQQQGSASDDSSGSGRARERRETTPSSFLPGEVSDLESDLAGQKRCRPSPPATAADQQSAGARTPPAAEIEEFFAAAEKAQATRFAAKYNFDVARGVPVDGGRFEWSPVVSS